MLKENYIIEIGCDMEKANSILISLNNNDGHCPCSIVQDATTKCPCKDFDNLPIGVVCNCGLFIKIRV